MPASSVAAHGYSYMFATCPNLTEIPELPAIILGKSSYRHMFSNCSNLTGTITLPAIDVPIYCYDSLLSGCHNVTGIDVNFTEWEKQVEISGVLTSILISNLWVEGAAESGTFICPSGLDTTLRGTNYIPEGWTVETK